MYQFINNSFGIKEVLVASKVQTSAAVAADFLIFAIKEVLEVVINLDFADWPFSESAAVKLKSPKYEFAGWALL